MYDVSDKNSIECLSSIMSVIGEVRGESNPLCCFVVGNKSDLLGEKDVNDVYSILDNYIDFYTDWVSRHYFCSSKDDVGVTKLMVDVLDDVLSRTPKERLTKVPSNDSKV